MCYLESLIWFSTSFCFCYGPSNNFAGVLCGFLLFRKCQNHKGLMFSALILLCLQFLNGVQMTLLILNSDYHVISLILCTVWYRVKESLMFDLMLIG
jgi:hypothetical protein